MQPWVDILAWGPFWVKLGVPKNTLLLWNESVIGIQGIPRDPNELYGPEDPFGCTNFAPNLFLD